MLTAYESKTLFAAVAAFKIMLSTERQLAALACKKLSMTEYRLVDLPVVVGRLTQVRFVPDERLGYFASRGKSMMVSLGSPQADGVAARLLRKQLITVRERDEGRTAPSLGNLARLHQKPMAEQAAWMEQGKAAGILFQPKASELSLDSANYNWHRSHLLEQPVHPSFMHHVMQPEV